MLCELVVHNLVIVDRATLRPGLGLTVVSGETGAGKSLLLDALSLLLGGRGSARLVGPHGDATIVIGVFQLDGERERRLEVPDGIDCDDGQLILRRRLGGNGRSQAWVNDVPVSIGALRRLGRDLVDVRVQHEHLRLADPARQLQLLDRFGDHVDLSRDYARVHDRCLELERDLVQLRDGERESLRELDFLRFLADEIEALDPVAGEVEDLERRQELLAKAQEWQALCAEATEILAEGDGAVVETLGRLARRLGEAPDEDLAQAAVACEGALDLVRDAVLTCARAGERITTDEGGLAAVDARLAAYYELMRKHGGTAASLVQARVDIGARIGELESLDQRLADVEAELEASRAERRELGLALARARAAAGSRLAEAVEGELAELGMPKARVHLHEDPQEVPGPSGILRQEFYVRTNPGIAAGPLADVPSGGESARLTLALAVVLAGRDDTPVLVFDEVDSGVGGRLGGVIGRKLAQLARERTVLAITHTPQLAVAADRHYAIRKSQDEDSTHVYTDELTGEDRLIEIAHMLGGGKAARIQAAALLERHAEGLEVGS